MSTEFDFNLKKQSEELRSYLEDFSYVESVSPPRIRTGEQGQYVTFGINFTGNVSNPDIKRECELPTSLKHFFNNGEEAWVTRDFAGWDCAVNTYGLNPNPERTTGTHSV
jgi:hypothetical protein